MFTGSAIDDVRILERLPSELSDLLSRVNGYVAYHGGLHVRGACVGPAWHSLRCAWEGDDALHAFYPVLRHTDVPFAEDALGDQFLLREGMVFRLDAEMGTLESLDMDLADFDAAARANASDFLRLAPLEDWRAEDHELQPGELLEVHPPFIIAFEGERRMRAMPTIERRRNLARIAAGIRGVPDGTPRSHRTRSARALANERCCSQRR
jgi:hypothetical protein